MSPSDQKHCVLNLLPRVLILQMRPTKQAPCEKPINPWNGPCVFQVSSTNRKLSSKPKAGPFRLVPLNEPSSLLNHQPRSLSLSSASVEPVRSSSLFAVPDDESEFWMAGALWGAVTKTKSAYLLTCFRNEPETFERIEVMDSPKWCPR